MRLRLILFPNSAIAVLVAVAIVATFASVAYAVFMPGMSGEPVALE